VLEIYFTRGEQEEEEEFGVMRGLFCQRDAELLTGVWRIRIRFLFDRAVSQMK
jgi:hypothetical protein